MIQGPMVTFSCELKLVGSFSPVSKISFQVSKGKVVVSTTLAPRRLDEHGNIKVRGSR